MNLNAEEQAIEYLKKKQDKEIDHMDRLRCNCE